MAIEEKMGQIYDLIKEIEKENQDVGYVFMEGFGMSINIIKAAKHVAETKNMDVSEKIQIVTGILGFSLEELVLSILEKQAVENGNMNFTKAPDEETLDFITASSDLDDYEKFVAQNSAKQNLEFLNKEI
jgi:hypothetical protein